MAQTYWEDVQEGMDIPSLEKKPTAIQLFMQSGITWNRHRIHYDKDWAAGEGYADRVIQGPIHGNALMEMLDKWIGVDGTVWKFGYSNRVFATLGDTLTAKGTVTKKYVTDDGKRCADLEIHVEKQTGEVTAPGTATVVLPSRG